VLICVSSLGAEWISAQLFTTYGESKKYSKTTPCQLSWRATKLCTQFPGVDLKNISVNISHNLRPLQFEIRDSGGFVP
jgi:hypothetical protein